MTDRRIKLTVGYDGIGYHGWQFQPGQRTIEGVLRDALGRLTGQQIDITGASRTDAGVSALGQQVSFVLDSPIPTENLEKAINDRLPDEIFVADAVEVDGSFDVISDVKTKLYRYSISTAEIRPVLQINHLWHISRQLDTDAMQSAANFLVGKHNFKSFASAADQRTNFVRTIFRCDVVREGQIINIEVEGDGFLYNMVRNIVGTLVEIGLGRWEADRIESILDVQDRQAAGPIAPAKGLCLVWIKY